MGSALPGTTLLYPRPVPRAMMWLSANLTHAYPCTNCENHIVACFSLAKNMTRDAGISGHTAVARLFGGFGAGVAG